MSNPRSPLDVQLLRRPKCLIFPHPQPNSFPVLSSSWNGGCSWTVPVRLTLRLKCEWPLDIYISTCFESVITNLQIFDSNDAVSIKHYHLPYKRDKRGTTYFIVEEGGRCCRKKGCDPKTEQPKELSKRDTYISGNLSPLQPKHAPFFVSLWNKAERLWNGVELRNRLGKQHAYRAVNIRLLALHLLPNLYKQSLPSATPFSSHLPQRKVITGRCDNSLVYWRKNKE